MNGEYIKAMDFDRFMRWRSRICGGHSQGYGFEEDCSDGEDPYRGFPEIRDHIDFFEELPEYDIAMYTHKKMKTNAETSLEVLSDVLPLLEAQEDFSNDALYATLLKHVEEKGVKNGYVDVADPYRSVRQTDDAGRSDRADGGFRQRGIHCENQKGISMLQK